jgi:hypothetical protein
MHTNNSKQRPGIKVPRMMPIEGGFFMVLKASGDVVE